MSTTCQLAPDVVAAPEEAVLGAVVVVLVVALVPLELAAFVPGSFVPAELVALVAGFAVTVRLAGADSLERTAVVALAVDPGISVATKAPMAPVPRTAISATAVVARRI
ncbi:MAG: hypothetical protein ACLQRM_04445 [Acidimicrobiales bacterium]